MNTTFYVSIGLSCSFTTPDKGKSEKKISKEIQEREKSEKKKSSKQKKQEKKSEKKILKTTKYEKEKESERRKKSVSFFSGCEITKGFQHRNFEK